LIAAGADRCLSRRWKDEPLFSTRTFGSSGKTLLVKVNQWAILVDTLQGIRQFWHQSGLKYSRDHIAAMIYTVPWWFDTVGQDFRTAFISGLIEPHGVSRILNEVKPHVVSCYPTNLKSLLPFQEAFDRSNLYLAVVHSEGSSAKQRRDWSRQLGVPVLDEYSSEEATRIALELPCGHYHVCEDTVYLEILDHQTHKPRPDGTPGLAVVTNLLNEAMPFIRYVQGDYVTGPQTPGQCLFGWSQLESVDGRINDSFVNHHGQVIPAGTILDATYRWMFETGVHIKEFELVQKAPDGVHATLQIDGAILGGEEAFLGKLAELLQVCLGHPVEVKAEIAPGFPQRTGKKRPIRRDFVH
jgi:phenylacetate-CoA ligase